MLLTITLGGWASLHSRSEAATGSKIDMVSMCVLAPKSEE